MPPSPIDARGSPPSRSRARQAAFGVGFLRARIAGAGHCERHFARVARWTCLLALLVCFRGVLYAEEPEDVGNSEGLLRATLLERKPEGASPKAIELVARDAAVLRETQGPVPRYFVVLRFRQADGWKIWVSNAQVAESAPGQTSVIVYLHSIVSNITLEAKSAAGGAFTERVVIRLPARATQLFEVAKPHAKVTRPASRARQLGELSLDATEVPLRYVDEKNHARPFITIRGHYLRKGWKLHVLRKDKRVIFSARARAGGAFEISMLALAPEFPVVLYAVGPGGLRAREILRVSAPARFTDPDALSPPGGPTGIFVSTGLTAYRYFQSAFGNFHATALFLGASYDHVFTDSRLGVAAAATGQVLTLGSGAGGFGPQVFQGDLDATYRLSREVHQPIDYHLLVGLDYVTLISNSSPFGFANLILPSLGVRAIWPTPNKTSLSADFRYAPAGDGIGGLFSLAQRNLELCTVYTAGSRDYPWQLIFRMNDLRYRPTELRVIELTTFSLSVGFGI